MKQCLMMGLAMILANFAFAADTTTTGSQMPGHDAWMKYATPGESHKYLKDFVGNWKYTSKFWMAPGQDPHKSEGTATAKMIMGDRYLQMDVNGTAMGQPFTGMSLMGYDNMKKTYEATWIDNMSTGITATTGEMNSKTKIFTEKGRMVDPMSGSVDKAFRNETKFKNKDKYTFTMYTTDASGKEFKNMEMEYTRIQ